MGELAKGELYANFRAWVPKKRIPVGTLQAKTWVFFDWGPADYPEPLIFLHGAAGSADAFFNQMLELGQRGYRVLSIELPICWHAADFLDEFHLFLDMLRIRKFHIYGAGLGGYLALLYASNRPENVQSICLTHAFINTKKLYKPLPQGPAIIRWLPPFVVKRAMLSLLPSGRAELHQALAIEFVLSRIMETDHRVLAARLALLCSNEVVMPLKLPDSKITLVDAVSRNDPGGEEASHEIAELFPRARLAYVKTSGDLLYLSDAEEINVHLIVHMRRNAIEPQTTPKPLAPARARHKDPAEVRKLKELAREDHLSPNYKYLKELQIVKAAFPNLDTQMLASAVEGFDGDSDVVQRLLLDGSIEEDWKGALPASVFEKIKRNGVPPGNLRAGRAMTSEDEHMHSHDYIARGPSQYTHPQVEPEDVEQTRNQASKLPTPAGPNRFPGPEEDDEENPLLVVAEKALGSATSGSANISTTVEGEIAPVLQTAVAAAAPETKPVPSATPDDRKVASTAKPATTTVEPMNQSIANAKGNAEEKRHSRKSSVTGLSMKPQTSRQNGGKKNSSSKQRDDDDDPWRRYRVDT